METVGMSTLRGHQIKINCLSPGNQALAGHSGLEYRTPRQVREEYLERQSAV